MEIIFYETHFIDFYHEQDEKVKRKDYFCNKKNNYERL